MATAYAYRARDGAGAEQRGVLAGASSAAVARSLAAMGLVPVDIRPQGGSAKGGAAGAPAGAGASSGAAAPPPSGTAAAPGAGSAADAASRAPPPRRARGKRAQAAFSIVLRELAALLRAGVPLMRALQLAADAGSDEQVRGALHRITRDLDNGHNLAAAAEHESRASGLIQPYDIAMLQVGEQTGRLPEAFADLHRQREFTRATGEQVSSALRYPAFVILTCLLAVVVVNIWVLPAFAKVFERAHAPLPTLTLVLMGFSGLMVRWWPLGMGAIASGVFGWKRWVATDAGRLWWHRHQLRLPVVGPLLTGIVLARLSGSLASAISAGLTISDALLVSSRTLGNVWFESRVQHMRNELARGASITSAARSMGVLPPTMLQLFAIGEESGSLEELMREISVHYQSEVDYSIKRLSATLEPILIWFLGIGVLILALGVFMPMWDLGRASIR